MKKQRPEIFFSILILVLGIILLLITPVGANFDEETYMARIWEMGLGHIMPNSYLGNEGSIPAGFYTLSYRRQVNLPAIDLDTIKQQLKVRADGTDLMGYETRAMYFPTLFAIQAVIMRYFGPHLHFPILVLYFLMRLTYLVIYCLLIFFAIKVIPFGKWVFGTLAIAPMCLIQAASVSADSTIFGVAFLFIAWTIKLASEVQEEISKRDILVTCSLILALGTLKPNTIFLLALLIIIPMQRLKKNKAWLPILIVSLVSISLSFGWSLFGPQYLSSKDESGIDAMAQFLSFFTHPQTFFKNFWITLSGGLPTFYRQAIGVAGYGYWNMPQAIYWIFPAAIILAALSERAKVNLNLRQRLTIGIIGLVNFFLVFVVFFIVVTPVGTVGIEGIQGRYFVSIVPLFIIPFLFTPRFQISKIFIGSAVTLCSLACVASLFMSYHVVCGYAMITNQPCILPYYKNWDPSTFLSVKTDKNTSIRQSAVITCRQLTGIQIWVKKNESQPGQQELFTLESEGGNPIQTVWIKSEDLPQSGWASIYFDQPVSSLNQVLQFEITPEDRTGIPGLELGYFPTNEFMRGTIWINEKEIDQDLVFKYMCADDASIILK